MKTASNTIWSVMIKQPKSSYILDHFLGLFSTKERVLERIGKVSEELIWVGVKPTDSIPTIKRYKANDRRLRKIVAVFSDGAKVVALESELDQFVPAVEG